MTLRQKFLISLAFLLILLILGGIDAYFTHGTLWLPVNADGVTKKSGPDPIAVVQAQGFTAVETTENFLLKDILPSSTPLTSRVLLQNNDRAAALAWVDSPDVKKFFTTLKERLRSSFSPALKDLIDETQPQAGKPPRDVLSFSDPGLSSDRIVFARVWQRLYEIHVTPGKEASIDALLDALTE